MAETAKKTTTKKPAAKKPATEKKTEAPKTYEVKVAVPALNIRKSHSYDADVVKVIHADAVCVIAETVDGWGKLATGEGWICLEFTDKI